jgi:NTE family protein
LPTEQIDMKQKYFTGKHPLHQTKPAIILYIVVGLLALSSCTAQYPLNLKVDVAARPDFHSGKFSSWDDSDALLLILAFSGGGTRAAALSYGTLEALQNIELQGPRVLSEIDKPPQTMLDKVSLITAVSGGSFTAAYYGLHGKEIFQDFRDRFLLRDVQDDLTRKFLNPFNWPRLWSSRFGRSDLAQEYYDALLFNGATLADMSRKDGPIVMILATDAINGITFPFIPETFDQICSDFNQFPVSRAVTASSAVPGPLSPVILKNYAGKCSAKIPEWIPKAIEKPDLSSRIYHMAVRANAFLDPNKKPYILLVDGGVSDNLGLRTIIDRTIVTGGLRDSLAEAKLNRIHRIAFIIVNAETEAEPSWGILDEVPGIGAILGTSSTIMVNKYNFETIDLLRRNIREWQTENASPSKPLDFYMIHLNFAALPDKAERDYFYTIPTTLSLPQKQVDRLRDVAARLLYASPDFQRLVADMGGRVSSIPASTRKNK